MASGLFARAFQGGPTFQGYFAFKLSIVMGVLALYLVVAARAPPARRVLLPSEGRERSRRGGGRRRGL